MGERIRGWMRKQYIEPTSKMRKITSAQSVVMLMLALLHGIFLMWVILLTWSGSAMPDDTLGRGQFVLILGGIILLTGCAMAFGMWSRVVVNIIDKDGSVPRPNTGKAFGWLAVITGTLTTAVGTLFLISLFPEVLFFSFWAFLCSTIVGIIAAYEGFSALEALK